MIKFRENGLMVSQTVLDKCLLPFMTVLLLKCNTSDNCQKSENKDLIFCDNWVTRQPQSIHYRICSTKLALHSVFTAWQLPEILRAKRSHQPAFVSQEQNALLFYRTKGGAQQQHQYNVVAKGPSRDSIIISTLQRRSVGQTRIITMMIMLHAR